MLATALTTVAALSLSACGSGDDSAEANGMPAGPDAGTARSASPAVSTSPTSGRPKIELPSDITYTFDWSKTGNDDKDAVLDDAQQFIKAVDMAIAEQNPLHNAYRFYYEGEAAAGSQKFIQEFVDYKDRITGTKRFYGAEVQVDDGTAGLVYCEDQNKAYNKSLKTGKTAVTPQSDDNYVLYNSRLRRNDQGVWITERLESQRGSARCRP
jgi:hypothetical protein